MCRPLGGQRCRRQRGLADSGLCDKVVLLPPEKGRSGEAGLGESHLEGFCGFFFAFFVKNDITLSWLREAIFTGCTVVVYQVNFLQCFDVPLHCLWLPWILLRNQLYLSCSFEVPEDLSLEEREELLDIRRRKKELIDDIERLKYEIAEVMTEIDNLTSVEESKTTQRNKQIAMGRKKFNMDPKKGIQFLIENDLLQSSPEDVAQFLYKGEGLNKTVIGDYLGERDDFNIKVLQAFVELHEFADLNLVQALRQFLWSFRLPGEAQKIDRMMEAFASRYCLCNPGVFQSTDTCYVLSFAIIMLNTSLHNHNVRDKPTAERFVTMNRGINEGGDLPEELLRNLYESIKNEPFKIPEDDGNDLTHTFFNPDREGWLLKLGGRVKTWKRRWFILTDNCLYYFEYTTDKEPRGIIPLENLSIREVEDPRKPNCFELYNPSHKGQVIKACKTEADGRVVEGNHVVYRISAPSPEEKEEWMKSIRASISRDPFYDMLATRKRRIANKK
ncbi:cytohesin-3 isoform X2 [Acinonyx jubatus]|uniref:Cytohesin-3 isoform X2 n=1 Tax=Acinonyx jubatus TaxID=32536 RepID=A0ABM3PB30_ACIJB|nr:cytohesin-3 isoform X2 [Acinonyx jubatus]